jgi:hypothetical protein
MHWCGRAGGVFGRVIPAAKGTISPKGCFRVGRYQMAEALTSDRGRSGEATAEDNRGSLSSPRERAAHYRNYAAQIRGLAASEQNRALRGRLIKIAREYEGLAKEIAPRRD